jgi:hypothetical protein
MIIDELKQVIKNTASVLVLEEGKPSFVIFNYEAYLDLVSKIPTDASKESDPRIVGKRDSEREILDKLNKEILALKDQIESEERAGTR